tara:strand:- start:807 stop:2972 length:2166 start_codon:yes stop_codon:yes gene_type:complete
MRYRYLKNLSEHNTFTCDDLSALTQKIPDLPNKDARRAWSSNPSTDHVFYSMNEGLLPSVRLSVNGENKVCAVWGIVAEYDKYDVPWAIIDDLIKTQSSILPTWRSRTGSGGLRLVWEFESKLLMDHGMFRAFMNAMSKLLKLERLFQDFDSSSLKFSQYFELGVDWTKVGEPIPNDIFKGVLLKVAIDNPPQAQGNISVPISIVAEEVHTNPKYKGRWGEDFSVGTRGPLFWLDDGIERDGCQVVEDGMVCYSDRAGKGFLTWKEIFGAKFVEAYESKKLLALTDQYWFNGTKYYKDIKGIPSQVPEKQVLLELKRAGFSYRARRGQPLSEMEAAILTIQNESRIDEVAPVIFSKDKVVLCNSHRILNSANLHPVEPAVDGDPKLWPFIHEWLSQLFNTEEALNYFYSWMQRFYIAVYNKEEAQGQALLLVGPTNKGKSLLSNRVIAALVGGFADASEYLSGQTNFNKDLARVAAWVIDDTTSAASFQEQRKATELIKKSAANPRIEYHAKYADAVTLPWTGRVILSLNMDPNSLSVIPTLDSSNRDKLMALKVAKKATSEFPPNIEVEATIKEELPHLARWLMDIFVMPKEMKGQARFGVKSFIDKEIEAAAYDNSSRALVAELVEFFVTKAREYGKEGKWTGTLTTFLAELHDYNGGRAIGLSGNTEFMRRSMQIMEESSKASKNIRPVWSKSTGGGKILYIDLNPKWDISNEADDND